MPYEIEKADIGVIGLAVMGENLTLNIENKGYRVAVYNRTGAVTLNFMERRGAGKNLIACYDLRSFVEHLATPRKIIVLIKAGDPVDEMIQKLSPLLDPADILIDGGNSHYRDTERRETELNRQGFRYVGMGISGGEYGALHGPSLMPGGTASAWPEVEPILESIAAKLSDGSPCCAWIGPGGAGHFVKMVHNGIEYADMQLISEGYSLLKDLCRMDNSRMQSVFRDWNAGELESYLIGITADILGTRYPDGSFVLDSILDVAGQKGTGKWTTEAALQLDQPAGLITEAVFARLISAAKELRLAFSELYPLSCKHREATGFSVETRAESNRTEPTDSPAENTPRERNKFPDRIGTEAIENALYASKLAAYAEGFELMRTASEQYQWHLDLSTIARIWQNGCIIRSVFLVRIAEVYRENPALEQLILAPFFRAKTQARINDWRHVIAAAVLSGIAVPCMSAALAWFDAMRRADSAANLIQAQRDYFGAHTFEKTDAPRGKLFHFDWTDTDSESSAEPYNV